MAEADLLNPVNMNGLNTELGHQNKYVMIIPIQEAVGTQFGKNLELNLTRFTIPQIQVGSTSAAFKGYQVEVPTGLINPDSKEITVEYLMDENWNTYRALFAWAASIGVFIPTTTEAASYADIHGSAAGTIPKDANIMLRCRVWLLNHYKRRILDIAFNNCWICNFSELAMDVSSPQEVRHSFTMKYTNFELMDPNPYGQEQATNIISKGRNTRKDS